MAETVTEIPGYIVGKWTIDKVHSDVSFTVRHMMVSKVRGHFREFSGQVVTAPDPLESSVTATIDLTSINTNNEQRDEHIRSADFFEVEKYPIATYTSTGVRREGGGFVVDGELTLKDVTRQVPLAVELNGFGPDPWGGTRAGFSATAEINRKDFNIDFSAVVEGTGGLVVGEKITISLEIEAVLG
ncbi:MAG TPA: YceI family protein [Mycobacteriales bacterium]|nr:YceI family protein [Mycobacteriales bacterium]